MAIIQFMKQNHGSLFTEAEVEAEASEIK